MAGGPPRRVCIFFDSRSRGDEDVEGSLQWTPATTLTTALKTFGSRTTHNCTHSRSVCSWMCVHRQIDERNAAASAAAVAQAAATAAVAPAIGALCISYTGPRPVQTLSDFELRRRRRPPQVQQAQQSIQPWLLPRGRPRGCLGGPATNQRHCLQLVRSPLHLVRC